MNNQNNVGKHWEANPNCSGACDELAKIAKLTLVITGTDDNAYQPQVNSKDCRKNSRSLACTNQRCSSCSNGSISG